MKPPEKLDLYKANKDAYAAPRKPVILQLKPALYLAIEGQGAPGGELFSDSIGALYAMAFTIKMSRKSAGKGDYTVCKLEGQWWSDSTPVLSKVPKERWRWNLLIRTPGFIEDCDLHQAAAVLLKKGKPEDVKRVRRQNIDEGLCVQMLHVGPYDKVGETICQMKAFTESKGFTLHGKHHEIYLSDPRRVPPERLRTILREPVRKA